ncbi:hypothetical protein KJ966_18700 [bacterium]|nr:hypothetical protein [bacterium]
MLTEPNGLSYMKARYYDPEAGRFISEDPSASPAATSTSTAKPPTTR